MDKIELELMSLQNAVDKAVITGDNAAAEKARVALMIYSRILLDRLTLIRDGRLMKLLYLRYFEKKKWREIADELGYEYRYIYKLRRKALTELHEALKCKQKDSAP